MNRRYLVAITFLVIAACVAPAPGPESPEPPARVEPALTTSTAGNVTAVAGEYDGDDVPEVRVVASSSENTVICERRKTTGSNIVQRVCRTKVSIERERRADQEEFHRLRNRNRDGGSNNE